MLSPLSLSLSCFSFLSGSPGLSRHRCWRAGWRACRAAAPRIVFCPLLNIIAAGRRVLSERACPRGGGRRARRWRRRRRRRRWWRLLLPLLLRRRRRRLLLPHHRLNTHSSRRNSSRRAPKRTGCRIHLLLALDDGRPLLLKLRLLIRPHLPPLQLCMLCLLLCRRRLLRLSCLLSLPCTH